MIEFIIHAKGNPAISARDPVKIIITKGKEIFDDSVIAIQADKSAADLPENFKTALSERKKIFIILEADEIKETIEAFGSYKIKLKDKNNIVITQSDFIDQATIGVRANKAAKDIRRDLIALLQDAAQKIEIKLRVLE